MKIDGLGEIIALRSENIKTRNYETAGNLGQDSLNVSETGQLFQQISRALKNVPDIRSEKVIHIKQLINDKKYQPDPKSVAAKVLRGN